MSAHTLHILAADSEEQAAMAKAIRGIRAAADVLETPMDFKTARAIYKRFVANQETPLLLADLDGDEGKDKVEAAGAKLESESLGVLRAGVDLDPSDLAEWAEKAAQEAQEASEGVEDEEESEGYDINGPFSLSACKTAMAVLRMSNGNPSLAYSHLVMLYHATEDHSLFEEAVAFHLSVFPPAGPGVSVL